MSFLFRTKKQYVYCGNTSSSMLAEVAKDGDGQLSLDKIATEVGSPTDPKVLKRLIAQISPSSASEVAIAFPLQLFEILSLSLPLIPDQTIARTLPYHIAKVIDKPLAEYIYDWQIDKRLKDQMQISVYLFPAAIYNTIQKEFSDNRLKVMFFEADAFAAFAYLDLAEIINDNEATLCVLIWPESLTLGVCEAGKIKLARNINLIKPEEYEKAAGDEVPTATETNQTGETKPTALAAALPKDELTMEIVTPPPPVSINLDNDEATMSVLSGFDLISHSPKDNNDSAHNDTPKENNEETDSLLDQPPPKKQETVPTTSAQDYLEEISVEIMRTRDYFSAVMKGKKIQSYYVIGAGDSFDKLHDRIKKTMGEEVNEVITKHKHSYDPGLHLIGLGAGTRW